MGGRGLGAEVGSLSVKLAVRLAIAAGVVAAAAYTIGLGIYAVASTRGPIATQPRSAGEARAAIQALGLERSYPFEARFFRAPHGRMHYVESGEGAPVLCLHGNPTWSFLYRDLLRGLDDRARVIAPDLIGFGLSEKPPDPKSYSLDGHIEDVAALIEALDLRDLTLVLHDWGGPIGLGAAMRAPDRVRRLVLINTWAFVPSGAPVGEPRLLARLVRVPLAGEQLVQGLGIYTRIALREEGDSDLRGTRRAYRGVQGSWQERAGVLAFPRLVPLESDDRNGALFERLDGFVRDFRGPVLLVWGMRDERLGAALLEQWRQRVPQAEILELENAGHAPQEDAPEQIVAGIRSFLDR